MTIEELSSGGEEEWNRFVSSGGGLLGHRAEWAPILRESFGHRTRYLVARDSGRIAGVLPLAIVEGLVGGRALVSLPWLDAAGVLAPDEKARELLINRVSEIAREEKCHYVEIRSLALYDAPRPVKSSKVLMRLPLADPDTLWSSFPAKVRNQVRKAERSGLVAEVGGEELLADFYKVFSRNMRDIGVPVWGRDFFRSILRRFGDSAGIILVRQEGRPVGGGLLIENGGTAIVPSASSLRSHFSLCPNHLLYWTALQESFRRGARLFDFGRSTPGSGTYHFKKQWGSRPVTCYWHYELLRIHEPPERSTQSRKLRLAVETWKRLPLPIANRLGPFVVRRIP